MGPLSTPANTTAIIAGKASGDLARFCPGQLERKNFDNDNAVGREKERDVEGDISHLQLRSWTSAQWPGLLFTGFWLHLFDLDLTTRCKSLWFRDYGAEEGEISDISVFLGFLIFEKGIIDLGGKWKAQLDN